MFIMNF
jgi:hypothetical protein